MVILHTTVHCRHLALSLDVAQVLDARDPLGSRCREVEQAVMAHSDKRLVLVLNKADLVPRENLQVISSCPLPYSHAPCPCPLPQSFPLLPSLTPPPPRRG